MSGSRRLRVCGLLLGICSGGLFGLVAFDHPVPFFAGAGSAAFFVCGTLLAALSSEAE